MPQPVKREQPVGLIRPCREGLERHLGAVLKTLRLISVVVAPGPSAVP